MSPGRKNRLFVLGLSGVVLGMVALSFAAVPLYRIFCEATGYAGTTQRAERAADQVLDRAIEVRFNADVNSALPWSFRPEQTAIRFKVGETAMATFRAENQSDETVTGTAVYNVTPDKAGKYFVKIQCFCFTQQVLKPHESASLPVAFYVDPSIAKDRNLDDLSVITLSYTFYKAQNQVQNRSADAGAAAKPPAAETSAPPKLAAPARVE